MSAAKHTPGPWRDGEGRTLFDIATELSIPQRRVLKVAARREGGFVCPIGGIHAAAQESLLCALDRKGLIDRNGGIPIITDAGRAAIAKATGAGGAS